MKLSVITTNYNQEMFLPRCIRSVLNSTLDTIEFILVDDDSSFTYTNIRGGYKSFLEKCGFKVTVDEGKASSDNCICGFLTDEKPDKTSVAPSKSIRFKFIQNKKNEGLFCSRVIGASYATGEYMAFLDADDYVGVDFYRRLVETAKEKDSDLVLADFIRAYDDHFEYHNASIVVNTDIDFYGGEKTSGTTNKIRKLWFESRGLDQNLIFMWAKLIRADLWKKCLPFFKSIGEHIVNTEDILFSTVLFCNANHLVNCRGVYYYNSNSSVNKKQNFNGFQKDVGDNITVFTHALNYLRSLPDIPQEWLDDFLVSYNFNLSIKERLVGESDLPQGQKKELCAIIDSARSFVIEEKHDVPKCEADYFWRPNSFISMNEVKSDKIREMIADEKTKIVSFDIFDTLVTRPFYYPTDLFCLLEVFVDEYLHIADHIRFRFFRIYAEQNARKIKSDNEDVTLDEIYDELQKMMVLNDEQKEAIKQKELELELKYCTPRHFAQELFYLARHCGKKIIITSDMYLPQNFLKKMLENCGYHSGDYEKIFVSSEIGKTKATGSLYKYVSRWAKTNFDVKKTEILHIGDNPESDFNNAKKQGWKVFFFPRTINLAESSVPDFYGGMALRKSYHESFLHRRTGAFVDFFGTRTFLAVYANKVFDNPFVFFNSNTDFNSSPEIFGYFALGTHLFALSNWLFKEMQDAERKGSGYTNINFMARDGYLPMEVYKMLTNFWQEQNRFLKADSHAVIPSAKVNFLHLSRRTIFPLQIQDENDIFSMGTNFGWVTMSPKKIICMTSEVCDRESLLRAEEICRENGFVWDECFESEADFFSFGSVYKNYFYSAQASLEYKKSFFSKFGSYFEGRAATFDIGYSCRVESILKKTFGFDVTPFYIHINNDYALTRAFQCGIDIKTFYNSEPGITGLPRELLISKIEGSLTCYEKDGDELKPVFAPLEYNRSAEKIIRRIQSSALQYCEDLMKTFGSDLKYLYYQREDVSLPLEWFLFNPKEADRELFGIIDIEDDIGITKGGASYNQFWDMQRAGVSSDGMASPERLCSYEWGMWAKIRPRFLQAIVLWKVDRALLKEKVCGKLSGHPLILNPIRFVYKSARFFYRKIRGAGKGGKS